MAAVATTGEKDGLVVSDTLDEEKYCKDPAYRLSCGPSVELWRAHGFDESLVGLRFSLSFADHGTCHGEVASVLEPKYGESLFLVTWTCVAASGSSTAAAVGSNESFRSELTAEVVLGCHFRGKSRPKWMGEKYKRGHECPLLMLPPGAELVDFEMPMEAEQFFPWVADDEDSRWWVTLCRLNDPACAAGYGPGMKAYPLPLLLTIIVLILEEIDSSVK